MLRRTFHKTPYMVWIMIVAAIVLVGTSRRNVAQDASATGSAEVTEDISTPDAPPAPEEKPDEATHDAIEPVVPVVLAQEAVAEPVVETPEEPTPIREQTIYIPYEDLRKTFEKEGRGVFLPYAKFRQLWDAAQEAEKPDPEAESPVGALITETENRASVKKDVVEVDALVKIELLGKGWHEIPLRLPAAAITSAQLDGKPARIMKDESGAGYKLLLQKKDDKPEQKTLSLQYAKAIHRSPGHNSVSFEAPQAPVSRWTVRIPESGVKVDFYPLIAATEVEVEKDAADAADGTSSDAENKDAEPGTEVLAFVGAAPMVRIGWTPKAEGATGLEALATVQSEQQVTIDEGITRVNTVLNYAISRAELDRLAIQVPNAWRVVNVFDANIRGWTVSQGADQQTIDVQLFEPAKDAQSIVVELERFGDEEEDVKELKSTVPVDLPIVKALGVGRQQGIVVVRVGEGLSAETSSISGLLQLDRGELPGNLKSQSWDFAFRYATVPYTLSLAVEKVQPRISVDTLVESQLEPQRLSIDVSSVYTIERAGVFQLEWEIPDGYDVRRVTGRAWGDVQAVDVESHHVEPMKQSAKQPVKDGAADSDTDAGSEKPSEAKQVKNLIVNLSRKAIGKVGLLIQLEKRLDEPDLMTPTGKIIELPLEIPTVAIDSVQRAAGRLMVYAPESLRVNPGEVAGLRSVSFGEAMQDMQPYGSRGSLRPVLAFAYSDQAESLALNVERRKPQVTIAQLLSMKIEDGVVKYHDTLFYDIRYSGVKSLRVDIPSDIAAIIRCDTATIRDSAIEPVPEDLEEGYVAWKFAGETELFGSGRIELSWEQKLEQLAVGGSVDLDPPKLLPKEVDRSWGQIVLSKAETIDLYESGESTGLRRIDPQHDLMPGAKVQGGDGQDGAEALAFEFHGPWSITITATRYELAEIKHTSIERAVLQTVVNRSESGRTGTITVRALYRIRSSQQRLQLEMPVGAEFNRDPMINGNPVALETESSDGKTLNYVPLVGTNSETPFLLELRYLRPNYGDNGDDAAAGGIVIDYPTFPTEPAMQEVYQCVYMPEEWKLIGADGPWTKRFTWDWDYSAGEYRSENDSYPESLLEWVAEGVPGSSQYALSDFPTDGICYLFSSLQPGASDTDALRLSTIRDWLLGAIILGLGIVLAVVLLPVRLSYRVVTLGVIAIGIIGIWIFSPLLGYQICNTTLINTCWAIVIIWVVGFAIFTLPRIVRNVQQQWKGQAEAWQARTEQWKQDGKMKAAHASASSSPFASSADPGANDREPLNAESSGDTTSTGGSGVMHADDSQLTEQPPKPYVLPDLEKQDDADQTGASDEGSGDSASDEDRGTDQAN